MGHFILATVLAAIASWHDLRRRIIPNRLTATGVLLGLGLSLIPDGVTPRSSALGMFAGGGLFLLFWLFRAVGAGDVKLVAAVGALVGWPVIWEVIFFTALAGGLVGLLYLIWTPRAPVTEKDGVAEGTERTQERRLKKRVPYAPAVALGVLLAWVL